MKWDHNPTGPDWKAAALELATRPEPEPDPPDTPFWKQTSHRIPAYALPTIHTATMETKDGSADYRVYIDQNGSIDASFWCHIQLSKDQPFGLSGPVTPPGYPYPWQGSEWSFIDPATAKAAALVALADRAEESMIEAQARGSVASQKAARTIRAWAEMQHGHAIPRRYSNEEIATKAQERIAQLAEMQARTAAYQIALSTGVPVEGPFHPDDDEDPDTDPQDDQDDDQREEVELVAVAPAKRTQQPQKGQFSLW